MNYKISKLFVFLLSILASFTLIVYLSFVFQNLISGFSFLDSVISKPFQQIISTSQSLYQLSNVYNENIKLKSTLYEINYRENEMDSLKKENLELKNMLNIETNNFSGKQIMSEVVFHNTVSWMDNLEVNSGKNKGVSSNFLAVANGGLIGWVSDVKNTTSRVELLTNSSQNVNLTVKIRTKSGDVYGVLEGYDEKKSSFIVGKLNNDLKIDEGDTVSTSGLGDFTVADLPVGSVLSFSDSSVSSLERKILVKPFANFSSLNYVVLIGN